LIFALAATASVVVIAVTAGGGSKVQAHRSPGHAAQRALAAKPKCFGAASRDPLRRCNNPALRLAVVPTPSDARNQPNAPCTLIEQQGRFTVCAFGVPRAEAVGTVALLGDSHAAHWRAALEVVARAKRWRGLSITLSGCPFSTATRVLPEPLRGDCIRRNHEVPQWFAEHPEVSTVFVSELSGATWLVPPGRNMFEAEVTGYMDAWKALPESVKHIVVIRDTPKAEESTRVCIEQAIAKREPAGRKCAVPRSLAMERDAAAVAAARMRSRRSQTVDLTRFFCNSQRCYPVIGGALVEKDLHHLTAVFVATLGPFLLRDVDALSTSWK
jgi:hypothetical protein